MSERGGNTLKLNPENQCDIKGCKCSPRPGDIQAKKEDKVPVKGFTKITHERQANQTFTLPDKLGDESAFENGPIPTATKVEAYYWINKPTRPILLAVTTTNTQDEPTYYTNDDGYSTGGVGGGLWKFKYGIQKTEFVKWLDELNCKHNGAIPIDLKNPENLSQFYLTSGTGCLNGEKVTGPSSPDYYDEYEVKEYSINPDGTYISRITYNGQPTEMTIPIYPTRTIKVYTWKNDGGTTTPLLVEFKTNKDGYYYHKNKGTSRNNIDWESTGKKTSPIVDRDLTNILDGARCNVFHTFKVDLSATYPYKNNECSERQIDVATYGYNPIENYKAYKHTYDDNGGEFTITEFMNVTKQDFGDIFPIRKVTEVVVYLCSGKPLLVYYKQDTGVSDGITHNWYKYNTPTWTSAASTLTTKDSPDQREKILETLDGIESGCMPPEVTIDISQKTGQQVSCTYDDPRDTSQSLKRRQINVTKVTNDTGGQDPPQYYDRYDHTVEGREASYFTLNKVVYGGITQTIPQIGTTDRATKVSVYYWKHGEDVGGKPLLVKVESRQQKSDPSIKSYTWYENTGRGNNNTEWKAAEGSGKFSEDNTQLKKKLDLLNCKLNNVVIVDASMKPNNPGVQPKSYCHKEDPEYQTITLDSSHHPKLKVEEESSSKGSIATYKAYEHTNNSSEQPFHIVCIKSSNKSTITLQDGTGSGTGDSPIMNVKKVIFYFCPLSSTDDPLLIYYEQHHASSGKETYTTHHWYKEGSGAQWTSADLPITTSPNQHTKILEQLDRIRSPCQPPKVTIKLEGPGKARYPSTYDSGDTSCANKNLIEVKEEGVPSTTDYKFFTHKVQGNTRDYFTVEKVKYGQDVQSVSLGSTGLPIEKVKLFSVYYWEPLGEHGNPLLIKVNKHGSEEDEWYENSGTNDNNTEWTTIVNVSSLSKPTELLKKLILLNCFVNNVTSINIAVTPSKEPPAYCHEEQDIEVGEQEHTSLIQVTDVTNEEPYDGNKLGKFVVYKHDLTSEAKSNKPHLGTEFHISDFKNGSTGITLTGDPSPIPALNVTKFLVYFCDRDKTTGKPLLIHFKRSDTPSGTYIQEWYQRMNDGSKTTWKAVDTGVPNGEDDIPSIYAILNNYATSCKDDTLLRILLGTAAGSAGGGATTYGVYEMIRWLFMSPWPRLM